MQQILDESWYKPRYLLCLLGTLRLSLIEFLEETTFTVRHIYPIALYIGRCTSQNKRDFNKPLSWPVQFHRSQWAISTTILVQCKWTTLEVKPPVTIPQSHSGLLTAYHRRGPIQARFVRNWEYLSIFWSAFLVITVGTKIADINRHRVACIFGSVTRGVNNDSEYWNKSLRTLRVKRSIFNRIH